MGLDSVDLLEVFAESVGWPVVLLVVVVLVIRGWQHCCFKLLMASWTLFVYYVSPPPPQRCRIWRPLVFQILGILYMQNICLLFNCFKKIMSQHIPAHPDASQQLTGILTVKMHPDAPGDKLYVLKIDSHMHPDVSWHLPGCPDAFLLWHRKFSNFYSMVSGVNICHNDAFFSHAVSWNV